MGAGETAHEPLQRSLHGLEKGRRQPSRRDGRESVSVERRVLGGDPALLTADPHPRRAPLLLEVDEHALGGHRVEASLLRLIGGDVADRAQHVVQAVGVGCPGALARALKVRLDLGQRARVDQLAQLVLAQQLAQELAIEGQRRRPPLRVRCVALVHIRRDVIEQERRSEGRCALRLHLDQRQLARVEPAEELLETGQVEHVAQTLAVGLEHDRKLAVALRDLQQRLRFEALLPQRGALAGPGPRQEQRAGGVFAEASTEQRGARQLAHHQVLDDVWLDHHEVGGRRLVGIGQVDDDAVVGPDGVGLQPELVADAGRHREPPSRVDAPAVRG